MVLALEEKINVNVEAVTTPEVLVVVTGPCELEEVTTGYSTEEYITAEETRTMAAALDRGKWVGLTVEITSSRATEL